MLTLTQSQVMQNWGLDNSDVPLVSVRCITYNHEPYIAQALDGFLMQKTNFPFEVIVHDDASTDRTADIIREYEKKFPKIIKPIYETENQYSKHDGSLEHIVNSALKGKYVAMCEGDDYWIDENKLQMQVDFLEENPEYSMCFHDATVVNSLGEKYNSFSYPVEEKDYTATDFFKKWIAPTASMVFIKKVLPNNKLTQNPDFIAGDILIEEQACIYGKVHGFKKKMSTYRIQENGLTWSAKLEEKRFRTQPKHYIALKENFPLISKSVANKKISEAYLLAAYKTGTLKEKIDWLIKAIKYGKFHVCKVFIQKIIKGKIA